ncbi:hypothetical protein LB565_11685 [Mesorhizobium sp. CA14]|uniref:hypothetical protein n=1 Tax=Mesorhizobium sp. CA14 TaxID=2876642 RepID=UPI001CCD9982|nr:hypothetical protein [Mesorhizobium sp. CA14]MBZ9848642.1 hypothetical protein [Mesorhizobium sp. CA14]
MAIQSSADGVREGLKRFRGKRLVQKDGYPGQFSFNGGTWVSHPAGCRFSIYPGHNWTLRLNCGVTRTMYVWDANLVFDGLDSVRISISRWLEEIERPHALAGGVAVRQRWHITRLVKEFALLPSSVRFLRNEDPAACCSHITVERINYTDPSGAKIEDLSNSDIEHIQALIERPMLDLLRRSVEEVHIDSRYYQEFAVPVVGELHWNWRNPMPELLAIQDAILDFVRTFTPERAASRRLSRYKVEANKLGNWSHTVIVEDQPDVSIRIPVVNREDPDIYKVEVRIAGLSFPLRLEELTPVTLETMPLRPDGTPHVLEYCLLFHPCSDRFAAFPKTPPGLTPEIGDRAAEHLKNAWLAVNLEKMRKFGRFVDVLII